MLLFNSFARFIVRNVKLKLTDQILNIKGLHRQVSKIKEMKH